MFASLNHPPESLSRAAGGSGSQARGGSWLRNPPRPLPRPTLLREDGGNGRDLAAGEGGVASDFSAAKKSNVCWTAMTVPVRATAEADELPAMS